MLSDRVCLSCLSVTLVYSGQTVGWIKMKLGMKVGLDPRHPRLSLDGDLVLPPRKGHSLSFLAHVCCGQTAGWIKMSLGTEADLGPGDIVLHGDPALPPSGTQHPPNIGPCIVAKRLDGSRCHLIRR